MNDFIISYWPFLAFIVAVVFVMIVVGVISLILPEGNIMPADWEHETLDDKYKDDQMSAADIKQMSFGVRESNDQKACARVAAMPFKPRKTRSDKGKPRGKRVTMKKAGV